VITHDDNDHSGNIENIKEDFRVNEIVFNGKDIITQWLYLDHLEFNQTMTNDNDSSLVYYIQLWNKRFLFLGDLSIQGEYQLIAHYPNLSIDVLKVGHHGSNTSTSYELIKHVKPQIGLISVGTNTYGHPHYEVIQTLNDFYITYFDSLNNGDVKIIVTPFISFILNSNNELFIFK
jgi:competence protein ComEC